MSGHVEAVTVSRCGWWREGRCAGDETGCDDDLCEQMCRRADPVEEMDGVTLEEWVDFPHPTEISHAEFLRQYGRCPEDCRPAEQLEIEAGVT